MNKANLVAGLVVNSLILCLAGVSLLAVYLTRNLLISHAINLPIFLYLPMYIGTFLTLFFLFGGKKV